MRTKNIYAVEHPRDLYRHQGSTVQVRIAGGVVRRGRLSSVGEQTFVLDYGDRTEAFQWNDVNAGWVRRTHFIRDDLVVKIGDPTWRGVVNDVDRTMVICSTLAGIEWCKARELMLAENLEAEHA